MKICPLCNREYAEGSLCSEDGATLIPNARLDDALVGKVLKDAYRIEEQIGAGGMGAVYRVTQIRLGRSVAVKILLPRFQSTPEMVRRFFREAQLLSQLNHPNIVSIIDFGNTEEGLIFMVMEFLEGHTLESYVPRRKGLPLAAILRITEQICLGLEAAHHLPLVHRDLKPGNIFISEVSGHGSVAKILDFGISKMLGEGDENLTQTGIVMGTPGFIAPEQITQSVEAGIPADIYALGGILYFMIGGIKPFSEHTGRSAMTNQIQADPSPIPPEYLSHPAHARLWPVVLKAMDRDPNQRYQHAHELLADLKAHALELNQSLDETMPWRTEDASTSSTIKVVGSEALGSGKKNTVTDPNLQQSKGWSGKLKAAVGIVALAALAWFVFTLGFSKKEPLVFGMSADFSGSNRELGREMQVGIQACFSEVNAAGGISGRPLTLVALDDRYEPEPARNNILELINDRGVFAIIGSVGTPTALAAMPVALSNKVLFFAPFTGAGFLRKDPPDRYVFNYRASYAEEAAAIVSYFVEVKGLDPASIAVFSQNDSFGDAGFDGVVRTLRKFSVKEENILHVRYQRNDFDVTGPIADVLAAPERARAVVTVGTYKQTQLFIAGVRARNEDTLFSCVSFVGARALAAEFSEEEVRFAKGVIITQVVPFFNSTATGVLRYRAALAAHFPNERPGFVSLEGYISARILVEALRQVPRLETEALIDTLEQIKDLDLGTGSVMTFGPSLHQASNKVWAVVMDENATFTELALD